MISIILHFKMVTETVQKFIEEDVAEVLTWCKCKILLHAYIKQCSSLKMCKEKCVPV